MLRGLFARGAGRSDEARAGAERIKALAREMVAFPAGTALTVSEIECADPACPGTETVILVMIPGRPTRAAKVAGAAAEIGEQELRSALVEATGDREP